MHSEPDGASPQKLYALVIYLPHPLGAFLDDLRIELVPGCNPHAHVSVLPPRALPGDPDAAIAEAQRTLAGFTPFEIQLGGIEKFARTDVIYITVEDGAEQLREMHRSLNAGALAFEEPFAYHPHITLAQEIEPDGVQALCEKAALRWREYAGPRSFVAKNAVFVRNTRPNHWIDLASGTLGGARAD